MRSLQGEFRDMTLAVDLLELALRTAPVATPVGGGRRE